MNAVRRFRWGLICFFAGMVLCLSPDVRAESLTLEECIDLALQRNVSVASARYSLDLARQNVWSAWGSWLPQFSLSASYSYYDQALGSASQVQVIRGVFRQYRKSISFDQNLFQWGGNWFNVKNKLLLRRSSEHELTQSELETIDLVKNYYFGALKSHGLLEVAEQAVEAARHNLELVQARYDLGSANQSELLKAKVQLFTNQASLAQAKRNDAVSLAQLNNVMNRPATTPLQLEATVDTIHVTVNFDEAMSYALESHPRILAAQSEMQAARYGKLLARAAYLPSVSWGGSRSYSVDRDDLWDSFNDRYADWSFGVWFSWPIPFFDGFSLKTSHSRATAGYKIAQLNLESTINSVGLDVQTALLDINNARANLILYEESLRSADEDLQIAQERYNLGAATILDLLDAEKNLADARNNFISAKFDFNLAVSALDKAMGQRRY